MVFSLRVTPTKLKLISRSIVWKSLAEKTRELSLDDLLSSIALEASMREQINRLNYVLRPFSWCADLL